MEKVVYNHNEDKYGRGKECQKYTGVVEKDTLTIYQYLSKLKLVNR